ncbi:MAG: S26 family signal peptidase [Saprospiraceae bacterium]|nr:S26 family signal peptidase [Saprospiraceae bacterium]
MGRIYCICSICSSIYSDVLIEAYVIPTPSMEGSLKVGDFLFVSKAHYGIRMPMTIFQLPLLQHYPDPRQWILYRKTIFVLHSITCYYEDPTQ